MKNLKRIGLCFTLVCALATIAFADGPDCAAPGTVNSPPCMSAQVTTDDDVAPSSVNSPPASEVEISIAEIAVDFLVDALSVF